MRLDARVKLFVIMVFTTLSVLSKDIIFLSGLFVLNIIVDIIMRIDLMLAVRRMRHFLSLIVFIAIVQSLTVKGGTPLIHIGSVNFVTTRGLLFSGEFILRMGIIILAGLIAATSDNREMTDALIKLKLPYEFAFMVSVALRFIPLFRDEFSNRINAIALRGIDMKKLGFRKKIKVYTYLISPTVSGSIIRSRELAVAMQARAFRAYQARTMLREMRMRLLDWAVLVLFAGIAATFLYFNYTVGGTII